MARVEVESEITGNVWKVQVSAGTEVAEGVEYLIRAEWVTGVALEVDGGIGLGVSNF